MDKTKILPKRRKSSLKKLSSKSKEMKKEHIFAIKKDEDLQEYDPIANLLDVNKMGAAVMQCLMENDTEGVLEIFETYLYALNKTEFLKEANVPRSTMYNFLKRRNPTIKTLAKIMYAFAQTQHTIIPQSLK